MHRKTIILDTDIGTDIDDSWALALLLTSPEINLKLITTATGDTVYRADLVRRILAAAEREDVAVAAGIPSDSSSYPKTLEQYLKNTRTPQGSYPDAATEIVRQTMASPEPVTLIAIAPLTNIATALALEPAIAERINLIGMFGSYRKNFDDAPGRIAEYNLYKDIESAQIVFNHTKWRSVMITPLDTCGSVRLSWDIFFDLHAANPLMREIAGANMAWTSWSERREDKTSILFDTVASYMAVGLDFLKMENIRFTVDNDGIFQESPAALQSMLVATEWKDKTGFLKFLVERLGNRHLKSTNHKKTNPEGI